jgi:adenylate cyclase
MAARNATVPPEQRIEFRMGIDLGDIIKDGRDIYGDGVNVASLNVVVLGCSIQLI